MLTLRKIISLLFLQSIIILTANQAYGLEIETLQAARSVGKSGSDLSVATTDLDPQMFATAQSHADLAGRVIQLHETNASLQYAGWQHLGNWNNGNILWNSNDVKTDIDVQHVALDINNQGCISEIDARSKKLNHRIKSYDGGVKNWRSGGLSSRDIDFGASTGINDTDIVIVVYNKNGNLYYSLGEVVNCTAVNWSEQHKLYDTGVYPSIAIGNEKNGKTALVEVHRGSGGLYYNAGYIVRDSNNKLTISWTKERGTPTNTANRTLGTLYSDSTGVYPDVAITKDTQQIIAINRYKKGGRGDNFDVQSRTGILTNGDDGSLLVTGLNNSRPLMRTNGTQSQSGKVPGASITNEGYAALMYVSGADINYSTFLIAQKLIKSGDWQEASIIIDELENMPLTPNKPYQFGLRPLANCFNIRDGNNNLLLNTVNPDNKHQTFNVQADPNGQIKLTLDLDDCNDTDISNIISTMTMNVTPAYDTVINNTKPHHIAQSIWTGFANHYNFKLSNIDTDAMFSLGFSVADNCVIIEQEDKQIYGPDSLYGTDEYYLADVFSNADNEISLTLSTNNCNNAAISDLISNIEIFKNQATTSVMPREDYSGDFIAWAYEPENDYFTATVSGLIPYQAYALTGNIQPEIDCMAIINNRNEIVLNNHKTSANTLADADGSINLILKIDTDADTDFECLSGIPIYAYMSETKLYKQNSITQITNQTQAWTPTTDNSYSFQLTHAGDYYITGTQIDPRAVLTDADGEPLFAKAEEEQTPNFGDKITLQGDDTIILTLDDDTTISAVDNLIGHISLVKDIPNLPASTPNLPPGDDDDEVSGTSLCALIDSAGTSGIEACDI